MIAIVAHDAGAANHIFAWLESGYLPKDQVLYCLKGPAETLFRRKYPSFSNQTLNSVITDASRLISGTGWASNLEHNARLLAKQKGIESIAVIDHWTNYPDRFIRDNALVQPDQIWVTDSYAAVLASEQFPDLDVQIHPNIQMEQQLQEIAALANASQTSRQVLFVMEPVRATWGNNQQSGEFQAFHYFIKHRNLAGINSKQKIVIKPHPSDPAGKYNHLVTEYKEISIQVDENSTLAELIASSAVVIGCQTYAMVIALHADKKVISAIPPYAPRCVLPQREIVHLSELVRRHEVL